MVANTLLSLGFGRGPAPFETDPHLDLIRKYLEEKPPALPDPDDPDSAENRDVHQILSARELMSSSVAQFDSPLSLQALVRNAVRHVLGGVRFGSRAQQLQLPSALIAFVVLRAPPDAMRALDSTD